jgi:hypothetical protein
VEEEITRSDIVLVRTVVEPEIINIIVIDQRSSIVIVILVWGIVIVVEIAWEVIGVVLFISSTVVSNMVAVWVCSSVVNLTVKMQNDQKKELIDILHFICTLGSVQNSCNCRI